MYTHIQFWTIFSIDIQRGRHMSVMASQTPAIWPFFNSMTWLYNSKGNICTLSYSRRNQLWYITLVLMEPPLRSFVKSMTTNEGLKSLPDRLFVQEYLLAYTYPDIMEIIRSLFLNYFATLRIPLTLPVICRIISLLIIRRILCAVLERYFCNRIPLQITRWPFCYSVSDRYRTFISANSRWKCSFYIVLISPNRHHRRYFLCQSVTKPLWHNRDIGNIGNTATLIEILRCSAIWSMEFPWWNHQKRTVFALWGEPSVTDEFPSQRASNAGLFFLY